VTPIEIQIDQNRLNLIDQEIFRLEREITELELISDDCDAVRARLDIRFDDVNSAYSYSQKMERLLECANKKKAALEKELRLNGKLRELREERSQIIARVKSSFATGGLKLAQSSQAKNLYQAIEQTTTMYDAFISHATEDKESFVNEFVEELKNRTVKVWVDALRIQWGDSLRKSIDEGLKKSHFGVVVISPHFIAKGWTQYELDGLFEREMSGGKVVLPIWHNITKSEVQKFSPSLAGRKAMTTGIMTAGEIADELVKLLSNRENPANEKNDNDGGHPSVDGSGERRV
jgi:hypothetical protein